MFNPVSWRGIWSRPGSCRSDSLQPRAADPEGQREVVQPQGGAAGLPRRRPPEVAALTGEGSHCLLGVG